METVTTRLFYYVREAYRCCEVLPRRICSKDPQPKGRGFEVGSYPTASSADLPVYVPLTFNLEFLKSIFQILE